MVEMVRSLRLKADWNRRRGLLAAVSAFDWGPHLHSQSVAVSPHCGALNDMMCSQSPLVEVFKKKCGALYIVSQSMP